MIGNCVKRGMGLSCAKKQFIGARDPMKRYTVEIEQSMKRFYDSLSEKEQRHSAVVEAQKLGHGGQSYVAKVLGCHRRTIWQGRQETGGDGLGHRIRLVAKTALTPNLKFGMTHVSHHNAFNESEHGLKLLGHHEFL
jgi:hypothetical protein